MVKRVSSDARANKATKVKAVARATAKATAQNSETESNISLKQVVVGFVIACFASILLAFYATDFFLLFTPSYKYEKYAPKNVYVVIAATSQNVVDYDIYYTVAPETWYNEDNVVHFKGKTGMQRYVIKLPTERIFNLRIDFGQKPGAVMVSDIRLLGVQSLSLNDFEHYQYNQFEKHYVMPGNQLFLISESDDPFMIYDNDL